MHKSSSEPGRGLSRQPCKIHAVATTPGVLVCRFCGTKIEATRVNTMTEGSSS
jgi:hypothetical protein